MADHNILGEKGEKAARNFLFEKGYEILHFNWRFRKNEIDIICKNNNFLVVVEVKTRTNNYFENPKDAVNQKKQKFIINATEAYINEFDLDLETRFDVISITVVNDKFKIEHIKDAFQPSLL